MDKNNLFSRTIENERKLGAYYTDLKHCEMISNLLSFPESEVCALEPSAGSGEAIKMTTRGNANVKFFGVEINKESADGIKGFEKVICTDFLTGIKCSRSGFTYCFVNPPYGEIDGGKRLEKLFLEALVPYLKKSGIVVYVVPYSRLLDDSLIKYWYARFDTLCIYKFHEKEFMKYKQVVCIGRKKGSTGYYKEDYESFKAGISSIDMIPELPELYEGEKFTVPPSKADDIEYFCKTYLDVNEVYGSIDTSEIYAKLFKNLEQDAYSDSGSYETPMPLKDDMMYLLAISGGGQGRAGSNERKDIHLQRGTVKRVKNSQIVPSGESHKEVVRETSSICLTIIENDGQITTFNN